MYTKEHKHIITLIVRPRNLTPIAWSRQKALLYICRVLCSLTDIQSCSWQMQDHYKKARRELRPTRPTLYIQGIIMFISTAVTSQHIYYYFATENQYVRNLHIQFLGIFWFHIIMRELLLAIMLTRSVMKFPGGIPEVDGDLLKSRSNT